MKANICPHCEQMMEWRYDTWYCTTPECVERQLDDMLFALKLAAQMRKSKRFVERRRAEAEEWLQGQEGGEA